MKKYKVWVAYECYGSIEVYVPDSVAEQGDTEVFDYLDEIQDTLPLPDDFEYLDGSFEIDREAGLYPYPDAAERGQ